MSARTGSLARGQCGPRLWCRSASGLRLVHTFPLEPSIPTYRPRESIQQESPYEYLCAPLPCEDVWKRMPTTPHIEKHFQASDTVRDIVIGMSDGLTVPFALAAGLSGTVSNSGIVVVAGLAEIAAGSIAMGLGGYLAARTDLDHYHS